MAAFDAPTGKEKPQKYYSGRYLDDPEFQQYPWDNESQPELDYSESAKPKAAKPKAAKKVPSKPKTAKRAPVKKGK